MRNRMQQMHSQVQMGFLARQFCHQNLSLEVLRSACGFYIGTKDWDGPVTRESKEYWETREEADQALKDGDWHQMTELV